MLLRALTTMMKKVDEMIKALVEGVRSEKVLVGSMI
jgi:hypothetical protein